MLRRWKTGPMPSEVFNTENIGDRLMRPGRRLRIVFRDDRKDAVVEKRWQSYSFTVANETASIPVQKLSRPSIHLLVLSS